MKVKKIIIILIVCYIILLQLNYTFAASNDVYYGNLKLGKRYMTPEKAEYWVTRITNYDVKELTIPKTYPYDGLPITAIYDNTSSRGVLEGYVYLEKVDLSSSNVEIIGSYCFKNCQVLNNFTTSPSLKQILGYAFQNANLKSLELNEGLETIKISAFEDAFSNDNSMYVINIPDTVTTIGENAFKVTDKNYDIVLVGNANSVAKEYCKNDSHCTFIERGDKIPTVEDLIEENIRKEKEKLFINSKFTYGNYNNTDEANIAYSLIMGSELTTSNLEEYNDIIVVDDGFIVVGTSYIDKYKSDSKYYQDTFLKYAKGNDDGIILKLNNNLSMQWFKSFGGSLGDKLEKIYKTSDGGYLVLGKTTSRDKDLLDINFNTSNYNPMGIKYDKNFNVVSVEMGEYSEILEKYDIINDRAGEISDGRISLMTKRKEVGVNLINGGYEENVIITKYDTNNYVEWIKEFDRKSNTGTFDHFAKCIETEDGYIFVGSTATYTTVNSKDLFIQHALIVKYNKPYNQIIISGPYLNEINIGEQKKVNVSYIPWEDVKISEMNWESEDNNIATVDYLGNVTAKKSGDTKIYLMVRGKTSEVLFRVATEKIERNDLNTGIKIETTTDIVPKNVVLNINKLDVATTENKKIAEIMNILPNASDNTKYQVFDINLVDENLNKVELNGNVTVLIPIPNDYSNQVKIYNIDPTNVENTYTLLNTSIETIENIKYAKFTTNHFSYYSIVDELLKGDINGDGKVNIKDWNRLYEHINETNLLNDSEFLRGDVNEDGKVNMKDWNRLYEHINETNPLF